MRVLLGLIQHPIYIPTPEKHIQERVTNLDPYTGKHIRVSMANLHPYREKHIQVSMTNLYTTTNNMQESMIKYNP